MGEDEVVEKGGVFLPDFVFLRVGERGRERVDEGGVGEEGFR